MLGCCRSGSKVSHDWRVAGGLDGFGQHLQNSIDALFASVLSHESDAPDATGGRAQSAGNFDFTSATIYWLKGIKKKNCYIAGQVTNNRFKIYMDMAWAVTDFQSTPSGTRTAVMQVRRLAGSVASGFRFNLAKPLIRRSRHWRWRFHEFSRPSLASKARASRKA